MPGETSAGDGRGRGSARRVLLAASTLITLSLSGGADWVEAGWLGRPPGPPLTGRASRPDWVEAVGVPVSATVSPPAPEIPTGQAGPIQALMHGDQMPEPVDFPIVQGLAMPPAIGAPESVTAPAAAPVTVAPGPDVSPAPTPRTPHPKRPEANPVIGPRR